jgi:predicted DNA-binding protein (UPF0251 family)
MRQHARSLADWEAFVVAYGWRAGAHDLAAVIGRPVEDVLRLRATRACARLAQPKGFADLFTLWHGRAPDDADWPKPRRLDRGGGIYEWQPPEEALLASLVGQISAAEIVDVLTERLRAVTGDPAAARSRSAVQGRINHLGLQATDVVGGLTTAAAAREIGSLAIVNQMIDQGQLPTRRVGRLHVIPYAAWEAWKASRVFAPDGYVRLTTLKEPLGIRSDKLSEYARAGLIPTAIRCNPYGTKGASTQFGTWWIAQDVAHELVARRRAGGPMPWQGRCADNLRRTYALWRERQHPAACATCAHVWGKAGAPRAFDDFAERYPPLAHGAKRHLTRPWSPGLTVEEVAAHARCTPDRVRAAIRNGVLEAGREKRRLYVTRTGATLWRERRCPTGEGAKSWIAIDTAARLYLFTPRELRAMVRDGTLKSKTGTDGAARGTVYVLRHQCGRLRDKAGFTEEEAARRLGITVPRLKHLLDGVHWRKAARIPLDTLQAVKKRLQSRHGHTVEEAAAALGMPVQWVRDAIGSGLVRVSRASWDRRRVYLSAPMLERLRRHANADGKTVRPERPSAAWLSLSDAAMEAGVSIATLNGWAIDATLAYREIAGRRHYHRAAVRARARMYWRQVRFHRATPPGWLAAELAAAAGGAGTPRRE